MHNLVAAALELLRVECESLPNLSGLACQAASFRCSECVVFIVDGPEFGQNRHVALKDGVQGHNLIVREAWLTLTENIVGLFQDTNKSGNPVTETN